MDSIKVVLGDIPKTAEGLRDALFDEINALRAGQSSPQKARAICSLAAQVVDSIRVQIQQGRLLMESDKKQEFYLGSGLQNKTANKRRD